MTVTANSKILRPSDPGTSIRLYVEASVVFSQLQSMLSFSSFYALLSSPLGGVGYDEAVGHTVGKRVNSLCLSYCAIQARTHRLKLSATCCWWQVFLPSAQVRSGVAAQVWRQLSKFILQRTSYCHL